MLLENTQNPPGLSGENVYVWMNGWCLMGLQTQHDPDLQSTAVQPETESLNSDKSPKQVGGKSKIYKRQSCSINL